MRFKRLWTRPARSVGALLLAVLVPACGSDVLTGLPRSPHAVLLPEPGFAATDSRIDRGTQNQGFGGTFDACQEGLIVDVVWSDNRNGTVNVYFNHSLDGGETWGASDVRVDHAPGAVNATSPRIARGGTRLYVVWNDDRNGAQDVFFSSSTDGGITWASVDTPLDVGIAINHSYFPQIAASGTTVAAVWAENVDSGDIYANVSSDGGVTWQAAAVRIDRAPAGGSASDPKICCSTAGVFVVWLDNRAGSGPNLYFNRSVDGGATWLVNDILVNTIAPGSGSLGPYNLCCDQASVYVAWSDYHSRNAVAFNRSLDAGLTWLPVAVLIDHPPSGTLSGYARLGCSGSTVYVAWMDNRNGSSDLFLNRSTDSGGTWLPTDVRVDSDAASAFHLQELRLACSGSNVCLTWMDFRTPLGAYFNVSRDGGLTWQTPDRRANTDPTSTSVYIPIVTCSGPEACVIWIQDFGASVRTLRSNRWVP